MPIALPLHIFIHFIFAVLIGYLVGSHYQRLRLGIVAGIIGGFLIDLDHVLEYFLVYGPHFNIVYLFEGRQFLSSNQIHLWFHGWEYIPVILMAAWLLRRKKAVSIFLSAMILGASLHLITDCLINQYPLRNYSLSYRYSQNFSASKILSAAQYQKYIQDRQYFGM